MPWLFVGCSGDDCERQSDCASGYLCTSGGQCVKNDATDPSRPDRPDVSVRPGTGTSGPDAGDAGAMGGDAGTPALARARIVFRELVRVQAEVETWARMHDDGGYLEVDAQSFDDGEGGRCVLEERTRVMPAVLGADSVRIRRSEPGTPEVKLERDAMSAYYRPAEPPAPPFLRDGVEVGFNIVGASGGLANFGPESLRTPLALAVVSPNSAAPLQRGQAHTFRWVSSGIPGERLVLEQQTTDDEQPEVNLRCELADDGAYLLPARAAAAFVQLAGARPAELRLERRTTRSVELPRSGGGAPVEASLEVARGARYLLP